MTERMTKALDLCRTHWGLSGVLVPLNSERDALYRLDCGDHRYVLRLTSPIEADEVVDFQVSALRHLEQVDTGLAVQHLVPDAAGRLFFRADWGDGAPTVQLLTWLEGDLMAEAPRSVAQARSLGAMVGRFSRAISSFDHPAASRYLNWDIQNVADLRPLLGNIAVPQQRLLVERALDRFERETLPALTGARRQIIHGDLTPFNVLVNNSDPARVQGLIDFGDIVRSIRVADVAIAACYLIDEGREPMELPLAVAGAFHAVQSLDRTEVMLFAPLMEARHVSTALITEDMAARFPERRAYLTKNTGRAWRGLERLSTRPMADWTADFLATCNMR